MSQDLVAYKKHANQGERPRQGRVQLQTTFKVLVRNCVKLINENNHVISQWDADDLDRPGTLVWVKQGSSGTFSLLH